MGTHTMFCLKYFYFVKNALTPDSKYKIFFLWGQCRQAPEWINSSYIFRTRTRTRQQETGCLLKPQASQPLGAIWALSHFLQESNLDKIVMAPQTPDLAMSLGSAPCWNTECSAHSPGAYGLEAMQVLFFWIPLIPKFQIFLTIIFKHEVFLEY